MFGRTRTVTLTSSTLRCLNTAVAVAEVALGKRFEVWHAEIVGESVIGRFYATGEEDAVEFMSIPGAIKLGETWWHAYVENGSRRIRMRHDALSMPNGLPAVRTGTSFEDARLEPLFP